MPSENEMLGPNDEPITVIEYHRTKRGWKPFSVCTLGSVFDFEWCQQDGVLAEHESGSGGNIGEVHDLGRFCAAPKLCAKLWYDHARCKLAHDKRPISDREARALGYQVIPEPLNGNPFDDRDIVEDDTTYCVQCGDRHPDDSMCAHVVWEEGGNGYCLGCGASEVDFNETQASLYRLLRMMAPKAIRELRGEVLNGRCPAVCVPGRSYPLQGQKLLGHFSGELRAEERYWPGIAWLSSLDGPCRDARALTVGWLWMFERASWQACCYVPEHRFIRHLPMPRLKEWLALNPCDPHELHNRPLRQKLDFKPHCANDFAFLKDPERCHEVTLWPPRETDGSVICANSLTLSVAQVKRVSAKAVDIFFGAVIERNGRHISELLSGEKRRG